MAGDGEFRGRQLPAITTDPRHAAQLIGKGSSCASAADNQQLLTIHTSVLGASSINALERTSPLYTLISLWHVARKVHLVLGR